MNNKYTFKDLVKEVLEIEQRLLTYTEIWESAEKNKISEKVKTTRKLLGIQFHQTYMLIPGIIQILFS